MIGKLFCYSHKITDALILYEQVYTPLVTTLNNLHLSIYTVVAFLRKIQNIVPKPGDPYIYRDYLKMDYQDIKKILLDNFISRELAEAGNRTWTDCERIFVEKISREVFEFVVGSCPNSKFIVDEAVEKCRFCSHFGIMNLRSMYAQ